MKEAIILSAPNEETLKAAEKWQKENLGKSNIDPEKQPKLPAGSYFLEIKFKMHNGEEEILQDEVSLKENEGLSELKEKASGMASRIGIHNFGLDDTQPVNFFLDHGETGLKVKFARNFKANGYPTEEAY